MITISNHQRDAVVRYLTILHRSLTGRETKTRELRRLVGLLIEKLNSKKPDDQK